MLLLPESRLGLDSGRARPSRVNPDVLQLAYNWVVSRYRDLESDTCSSVTSFKEHKLGLLHCFAYSLYFPYVATIHLLDCRSKYPKFLYFQESERANGFLKEQIGENQPGRG